MNKCSQAALDLIWNEETGGDGYYEHTDECWADYPGGASGVTIGGFYDCGYVTRDDLRRDWGDKLPAAMIDALEDVVGIKGPPARSHAKELDRIVSVPYTAARYVFDNREIPKWEAVVNKLPNADKLSPDSFGALVSIAMNRGNGFGLLGDRYREMRFIKVSLFEQRFALIPAQIREMQRLWPKGSDLWKRREHEAQLFEQGLKPA